MALTDTVKQVEIDRARFILLLMQKKTQLEHEIDTLTEHISVTGFYEKEGYNVKYYLTKKGSVNYDVERKKPIGFQLE